ncbi:MAG: hypothetical protein WBQ04_11095, partial [Candidatus Acidiferrales bacterium]
RRSVKAFRREPALGGLLIAYILCGMIYSVTEAGFRMMDPIWIFFLLGIIEASNIAAGVSVETSQPLSASINRAPDPSPRNTLAMGSTGRTMAVKSSSRS